MTRTTFILREAKERWHNRTRIEPSAWTTFRAIGFLLLLALIAGH